MGRKKTSENVETWTFRMTKADLETLNSLFNKYEISAGSQSQRIRDLLNAVKTRNPETVARPQPKAKATPIKKSVVVQATPEQPKSEYVYCPNIEHEILAALCESKCAKENFVMYSDCQLERQKPNSPLFSKSP